MKRFLLFASQLYSYSILRPIQKAIRDRGDDVSWFLYNMDSKYIKSDERVITDINSVMRYDPFAVITCNNWVPYFFPGIKVEVFHGFNAQKRDSHIGHFRMRGWFDLYCTQGPSTTENFQELAKKFGYFHVAETGWSKLDPLFTPNAVPDYREQFNITKPIVLYTSTFTQNLSSAPVVFDTIKQLAKTNDWYWFINLHPKMDKSIVKQYKSLESDNVKFFETDGVLPLLKAADVMLSDTSSIVFEFLTLDKPVVTFRHRQPGPYLLNITDTRQIESSLNEALARPQDLMNSINVYANELHPYRDGKSSERVLHSIDYFSKNVQGKLKRKPLNLGRKLMVRKRFHYFGI
jgi:CDP-glycerol glycerophosphotransferase (TagB/SpsB family)